MPRDDDRAHGQRSGGSRHDGGRSQRPGGPPHRREPTRGEGAAREEPRWQAGDGDARPGHPQQGARSWDRNAVPPSDRGDTGRDRRHSAPGTPSDRREGAGAPFRRPGGGPAGGPYRGPSGKGGDRWDRERRRSGTGFGSASGPRGEGGAVGGGHPPGSRGPGWRARDQEGANGAGGTPWNRPGGEGQYRGRPAHPDEDQRPGETRGSGEGDAARPGRPVVARGPGGPGRGPGGPGSRGPGGPPFRARPVGPSPRFVRPEARAIARAPTGGPQKDSRRDRADQLGRGSCRDPNAGPGRASDRDRRIPRAKARGPAGTPSVPRKRAVPGAAKGPATLSGAAGSLRMRQASRTDRRPTVRV